MVKGVNKTVIEVNDTGSKMFEKIVFYVTPQYGNLSAKQLKRAAREFSFSFNESGSCYTPLRNRINKQKKIKLLILSGSLLLAATITLIIIL